MADTDQAHAKLTALGQTMTEASEIIEAATTEAEHSTGLINKSVAQLSDSIRTLTATQNQFASIWEDYQKRFVDVDRSLEQVFTQINEGMHGFADMAGKFMIDLDQHAGEITGKLAGAVNELGESIDELVDSLPRRES